MILNKPYLREIASRDNVRMDSMQWRIRNNNERLLSEKRVYDLFISHSSLDRELILTLVDLFNKSGYSVYVDWINDRQLNRNNVDRATAETLRNRMQQARGLAYIATSNTTNSKWCPWELGYMDGKKDGKCTILPVLESSSSTFKGQEYLGLYYYLTYAKVRGLNKYDFWVNDNDGAYVTLLSWLNGSKPKHHI